jgi:hypothetical protein
VPHGMLQSSASFSQVPHSQALRRRRSHLE